MSKKIIIISIVLVIGYGAIITGIYVSEYRFDQNVKFYDIIEDSIIVLMGEYPNEPASFMGRILQLLLFLTSILISGTIIGKISSIFIKYSLQEDRKMKKFTEHIIICNWNQKAKGIIKQIMDANIHNSTDILVVTGSKVSEDELFQDNSKLHFIHADPSQHTTLENIQAHKAKSVILLTDPESADSDAKNALIALAIKHLESEKKVDVYIISELENLDKKRHLMEAGVDEVICNLDFNIGIIAQSALFKNMSQVYQQLLSYSNETNEIYFIPPGKYPAEFIEKDFPALTIMINEKRVNSGENPLILLGIKRGEEILLNPVKVNFSGLHEDDSLIIMAFQYISEIRM